jgi:dTDP-4-dehydrorhamnose reductase
MRIGRERGHTMFGTYREHETAGLEPLDLLDARAVRDIMGRTRPAWVVDCAAWSWVDGNELDAGKAQRENVDSVARAAAAAEEARARWCLLSSSYVFDGKKPSPYSEDDPVSPLNVYGRTKVQAEQITRSLFGAEGLIVRTVVVWGPDPQGKNFAQQIIRHALHNERLQVPFDQLGNPTYGPDLAATVLQLMERQAGGAWNVAGPEAHLNRLEFASLLCASLGLDTSFLEPVTTAQLDRPARRPLNAALATGKLDAAGLTLRRTVDALRDWRSGSWEWPWAGL